MSVPGGPYGPQPGGYAYPGPPPENYLVWSILVTVLCCLPFGIVAIIKSTQVESLWSQGHVDAARQSAESAKKWAIWGAIAPAAGVLLFLLVMAVLALVGAGGGWWEPR